MNCQLRFTSLVYGIFLQIFICHFDIILAQIFVKNFLHFPRNSLASDVHTYLPTVNTDFLGSALHVEKLPYKVVTRFSLSCIAL